MNATATMGKTWGQPLEYMADEGKKKKTAQKKKGVFDYENADIEKVVEDAAKMGVTKGSFINRCIRLAWRKAYEEIATEVDRLLGGRTDERPSGEKKTKEERKP